eukprot:snap_masked-scaffold_26-processed-gene-0.41-mRNA-1 protein AED:1.00 eAED:1.00 QI:0/0/0/0/1/1/3/0/107
MDYGNNKLDELTHYFEGRNYKAALRVSNHKSLVSSFYAKCVKALSLEKLSRTDEALSLARYLSKQVKKAAEDNQQMENDYGISVLYKKRLSYFLLSQSFFRKIKLVT